VILTVSQMMWCRDVTIVLRSAEDKLAGMQDFELKCFQVVIIIASSMRCYAPAPNRRGH